MADRQDGQGSGQEGEAFKRWTAKRKTAVVLELLKGTATSA
ncbi:MAG TPA: hypothetical protein VMZ31_13470 [Phycisphaerae bacterium]|nr:hypothetical protein [Phycisphaerae bacterium]